MNAELKETTEIPAALPISDAEDERERFLDQADDYQTTDDKLNSEAEDDDEFDEIENEIVKPSKKKLFLAFVGFVFGFVLLVGLMSWFFGIGVFAKSKAQAVDRTAKNASGSTTTAPASEEEKLKMALNLVAEKERNGQTDLSNTDAEDNNPEDSESDFNSSVDIPSTKATDITEPLVIPSAVSPKSADANQTNSISPVPESKTERYNGRNTLISPKRESSTNNIIPATVTTERVSIKSTDSPPGRSLFFGIERKEKAVSNSPSPNGRQTITTVRNENTRKISKSAIPFGKLLHVRILGAVYTLRNSGGLVRMELTRKVKGENYSYPAGTVLVGNVRGSEYKRAFISVIGLIDPKTGGLIKLKGEVMGKDGASGVAGRRRKVKSAWSRVLGGLRDAGATALGAISGRRSNGTVIISDSTSRASQELSDLVGDKRKSGEFIEVSAGTLCFVQITDLPNEVSDSAIYSQNKFAATGLDADEIADLLSSGSPEKIRALMPRMTPEFRRVAEKVLSYQR